ncbi:hypothetical protein BKA63DRAFT_497475 [Paraphoma chrysanthemicola]|nr:hypothetical protein BKA63DRAFT_497475 [Paraphoma chrysanthemicola]
MKLAVEVGTHAKEVDKLRAQLAELQTKLTESNEDAMKLAIEVGTHAKEADNLRAQLAELQTKLTRSNEEVRSQQDQIRGLRVENASLNTNLMDAHKMIKSQSKKIHVQAGDLKRELDRVNFLEATYKMTTKAIIESKAPKEKSYVQDLDDLADALKAYFVDEFGKCNALADEQFASQAQSYWDCIQKLQAKYPNIKAEFEATYLQHAIDEGQEIFLSLRL